MRCRRSPLVAVGRCCCCCCHRCCHPCGTYAPGHLPRPALVLVPRPSPIGLTAADLFAGGEVSRA